MAFARSSNFTIHNSTFIDQSTITKTTGSDAKRKKTGRGLQILLNASSTDASFDSQARHPPPICHPSTRTGLLEYIFQWVDNGEDDILFLDGPAGAGKTAIAQTVAARCAEMEILLTSYFFFRGSPSRNTIAPLIPTMAYQIGTSTDQMRRKMKKAIERDPSIIEKSPEAQARKLILKLYQPSLFQWNLFTKRRRYILVIDGLDECSGDNNQRQVVELLSRLVGNKHFVARCFIASRPEPHILSAVCALPTKIARVTLNEREWDANGDIRNYLQSGFDKISSRADIPQPWPSRTVIETLVKKSGGIFIYASTVLKYVGDDDSLPTVQLEHVLKLLPGTTPFAELDQLYQQILMACPLQHRTTLLHIFGITFLRNPAREQDFDIALIEALLGLSTGEASVVLRKMHSILVIRGSEGRRTISFLHASLGDFIFNKKRSGPFYIDFQREHLFLAGKCVEYMNHRESKELNSTSPSIKPVIIYAWNSWTYHGSAAGDTHFPDLIDKLWLCDKTLWADTFPESYHNACMDGLEQGITWLQQHRATKHQVGVLISDLIRVKQTFGKNYCTGIIADPNTPLAVLRVFENPGIQLFDLHENDLVILWRLDKPLELLYFKYEGRIYDLMGMGGDFLPDFLQRQRNAKVSRRHGAIAIHCVRILQGRKQPMIGIKYAAKYWAQHLYMSDISDDFLEEVGRIGLQEAGPERQITVADAILVIQWLTTIPDPLCKSTLLSIWKGHLMELRKGSGLGLGHREFSLQRKRTLGVVYGKKASGPVVRFQ